MRLWAALLKFGFQTDLLGKNSAGAVAFDFSNQSHALVMLYVQFLCSDSLKFDRWVHVENLCSIWKLAYWWLKLTDFMCHLLMFSTVFSTRRTQWNTASIKILLLFHCWFVYWVSSWEVRCLSKSSEISLNGTIFVFHLAWYVTGLKSHKRFRPYLMASRSCILTDKPE